MYHLQFPFSVSLKWTASRNPCKTVYLQNPPGLVILYPKRLAIAATSNSTAITLVTHLHQIFPKNPTLFPGGKKVCTHFISQHISIIIIKTRLPAMKLETNTTSGEHTTRSVQAKVH